MTSRTRASLSLAVSLLFCITLEIAPVAASDTGPLGWRGAKNMSDLTGHLERWLDEYSGYPRRDEAPVIKLIDKKSARVLVGSHASTQAQNPRGLYDPVDQTIRLVLPWSMRDPHDVAVLLHELAHHRQAAAGHWYCPGAQELPAYRLQEAWLGTFGLKADINWIAVVLQSGCAPRDVHPD